jgi:hypothetical protein
LCPPSFGAPRLLEIALGVGLRMDAKRLTLVDRFKVDPLYTTGIILE